MKKLSIMEIKEISGGNPELLPVVGGALFGAVTGFFVGGPAGALTGAYMGSTGALIKEASYALTETIHPEYGARPK